VRRDGRDLGGAEKRLAVGWAGPDLELYGELTGEENLRFFRRAAGFPAEDDAIRARLEAVGLPAAAARRPVEAYSTGMRQRLRLAFAMLFDPPLLVLDEPYSGLDAAGRAIVKSAVADARRRGAVVLASNDERDLENPEGRIELPGGIARSAP
jgi:ABC-type multidrug transport system ATPase subunit